MLHEFLKANYSILVSRCRAKLIKRSVPRASDAELLHGIPLFLEQLIKTLQIEETPSPPESRQVSGASDGAGTPVSAQIGEAAAKHGSEMLRHGFTVDQVVHDYGDLCQAVTELAIEQDAPVTTAEFRTLNRCLDNAIADAVTEFGRQRDNEISAAEGQPIDERLGALAHELRNLLNSAVLALAAIKRGHVGVGGSTGAVLERSLTGLRRVIDRSLADARLTNQRRGQPEWVALVEVMAEAQVSGQLEAITRQCSLTIHPVDLGLAVYADRQMLSSAIANLLQNAFKFSKPHGHVSLSTHAVADRVLIEIEDQCGGLPVGAADNLFRPFEQHGADRTGLGLGLSITQRSVEASGGTVRVRDLPGKGCVFTIDLPLRRSPEASFMKVVPTRLGAPT